MNRIRELRHRQNQTLREVSKIVGINADSISKYERGDRWPKIEVWKKLADYFDVSIPYLQGISEDPYLPLTDTQRKCPYHHGGKPLIFDQNITGKKKDYVKVYIKGNQLISVTMLKGAKSVQAINIECCPMCKWRLNDEKEK